MKRKVYLTLQFADNHIATQRGKNYINYGYFFAQENQKVT